ncbi:galactocerebrosidase isoform X2 [Aplysia californica]|uniref:galactosylceramidase n=1 Tax=Aplysia californica TaxID=6500 RepID=A0ABM0JAX8_APLCA|nr:galactocerebrosidase isoform X2 [Aplysia californica]
MAMHFTTLVAVVCATVCGAYSQSIVFDDAPGMGRQFDGIGGLSGGGATSKLLVNYPQEQRDQILDYLFKPNFGASLHILKVEIGGDVQSTDGTEASHMHNSWEENYQRGYEWWLMKEAKKRNPNIKLYGLPWGFPGWIGQGTRSPYVNVSMTADYIVRWINGAKVYHNLTIDYVGIWNERPYDISYIKALRATLDARGFQNTLVIAADEKWEIATDIQADPALAKIVHAIGCHYPGTLSDPDAVSTGKQLWASEDYSTFNDDVGGGCWARILNQNYVNGLMTATISWNLIASYYDNLPFYGDGLMTAVEPWSGNYVVETPIWVSAHTTQFAFIGWNYLKHDSGVGKLPKGGSYVGLVNPTWTELTIVIETMTHNHSLCVRPPLPAYNVEPQVVTVSLAGKFSSITEMNVWYSKLGFDGAKDILFEKKDPIKFVNGKAQLSLGLDEVITLTTMTTGQKGVYPEPPPSQPFPLPYTEDFESYSLYEEPFNLAQQSGAYEILSTNNNKFARQMTIMEPVFWCKFGGVSKTVNVIGSTDWTDIYVAVDFQLPVINGSLGAFVAARVDEGGCEAFAAHGIFLFAFPDRYIVTNDLARTKTLKEGSLAFEAGEWHRLGLLVQDGNVQGSFDNKILFNMTVPALPVSGFAAIGTDTFGLADFDNLQLTGPSEGRKIMSKHLHSKSLYFEKEHH